MKDETKHPDIEKLSDAITEKGLKITFGLQPDHIAIIEKHMPQNRQHHFEEWVWDKIGKEMGWEPKTALQYYLKYQDEKYQKLKEAFETKSNECDAMKMAFETQSDKLKAVMALVLSSGL